VHKLFLLVVLIAASTAPAAADKANFETFALWRQQGSPGSSQEQFVGLIVDYRDNRAFTCSALL
jgi:hypothetical protein